MSFTISEQKVLNSEDEYEKRSECAAQGACAAESLCPSDCAADCFNTGLSWAEEVPRLLVTLFAFIACAIGVRDHLHVAVNAVYNQLPVGGKARKALDVLTDVVVLLCGLFMLYTGGARTMKLFSMPGTLPITGISTAWQYLPIPIAGFVITFDSLLFLTGIVSRDDLLYSEKEIDYTDVAALKEMEKKEDEHK